MQFYWLTAFGLITGDQVLPDMGLVLKYQYNVSFYFQEKLMTKVFKKSNNPCFGAMWPFWPFLPKFGHKWIFLEKRLSQFLNIPIIYHHAKNQEQLICHYSWGWMDRRMDGHTQTEEQTDNHDFVGPSIGQWTNY